MGTKVYAVPYVRYNWWVFKIRIPDPVHVQVHAALTAEFP